MSPWIKLYWTDKIINIIPSQSNWYILSFLFCLKIVHKITFRLGFCGSVSVRWAILPILPQTDKISYRLNSTPPLELPNLSKFNGNPMYKNLVGCPFQLKFAFVFFYSWTLQNVFTSENAGECFFQSRVILATQFKALGVIWSCNTPFRSTQLNSKPTKEKKTHHQWTPIPEIPNNMYHAISYNTIAIPCNTHSPHPP